MKTITIHNVEAETSRQVEVEEEFYAYIKEWHIRMGFFGEPESLSERTFNDYKKSFETLHSAGYAKFLRKWEAMFGKK